MTKRKQVDKAAILRMLSLCPGSVLVGGSVRSLALGLSLSNDIDLLVPHSKLSMAEYCEMLVELEPKLEVLKQVPGHGGGSAKCYFDGYVFDVTVTSQMLRANMLSRDFTVNAMWLSAGKIEAGLFSEPADVVQGLSDARHKVLDTPGDEPLETLLYDPCRVVRAVRLCLQLTEQCRATWKLSPALKRAVRANDRELAIAIRAMAASDASQSRLRNELTKLFSCASAVHVWAELSTLPELIVFALLSTAGGKLALKGN